MNARGYYGVRRSLRVGADDVTVQIENAVAEIERNQAVISEPLRRNQAVLSEQLEQIRYHQPGIILTSLMFGMLVEVWWKAKDL
jgi:hypothetical protein